MKPIDFNWLIEASLEELLDARGLALPEFLALYRDILIAHMQGDVPGLKRMLISGGLGICEERRFLECALRLRIGVRERAVSNDLIKMAEDVAVEFLDYAGELYFLMALGAEVRDEEDRCRDYNRRAAAALDASGARKKAVKALHNALAAETRIRPEEAYFAEYNHVIKRAKKVGDKITAGVALRNLARVYQRKGAYTTALDCVNEALILLETDIGTIHYYQALLNRCHIFLELQRLVEAFADYEKVKLAPFPEVRNALGVLATIFEDEEQPKARDAFLTKTWRERNKSLAEKTLPKQGKLTPAEDHLLQLLSASSKTKHELIDALYGRLDFASAENRLKNLLSRLKKKLPGEIVLERDRYVLVSRKRTG